MTRAKVPKYIVEAIERAWPDGVIEMIDLSEAPFWDTYPALKAGLSRISGSDLVYEREPEGGPRWDEGSDPNEDPPDWGESTRSYQYETFENGSRSEPGIELLVFDLEGKRLDAERHYLEMFDEEPMRILAEQRDRITRIVKQQRLSVLPGKHLDTPLLWLRAAEDVLQGSTGEPLTVRDAFFFATV